MADDWIPKAGNIKVGGLSRAAQKLQAARDKAERAKSGDKSSAKDALAVKTKGNTTGQRKTSFQRKAV